MIDWLDGDFEAGNIPTKQPRVNVYFSYIFYQASITAQGIPEPLFLRGSKLCIRAAEHNGCNWVMQVD